MIDWHSPEVINRTSGEYPIPFFGKLARSNTRPLGVRTKGTQCSSLLNWKAWFRYILFTFYFICLIKLLFFYLLTYFIIIILSSCVQ